MENMKVHHLADYKSSDYLIDTVDLVFDFFEEYVEVTSNLRLRANYLSEQVRPLVLDGDQLELISVALNERQLLEHEYQADAESLTVFAPLQQFILTVKTKIYPDKNQALMGLYRSQTIYCTQCEPHGFRRITYYLDRPDVMAIFTVTIFADKKKYPLLLSNGNKIEQGTIEEGRHWAKWHDPFKKPCYLFALVAGDLACLESHYTTLSGRQVDLLLYTEPENKDKCEYAMRSLQVAMRWDEKVFGLEYDLDNYMIVAVNDFNMGAMENKGLNIFNSRYILANSEIATDTDYQNIEQVVAHEYFHNWTGNRVTLRDWFQLSLKEGLTVFRDQEFSAYQWSAAVKRIEEVRVIKVAQFAEDAGPLAHSVRPESYIQMNNFYTATVYRKGAEVVRMLYRLLGANGFRYGMDMYFTRFDGHAVTTDDFVRAMSDANHIDLEQFKRWYSQAGTPVLDVEWKYDSYYQTLTLTVEQSCPATPGQAEKLPLHMPLVIALLDKQGKEMPLNLAGGERAPNADEFVLNITKPKQQFRFYNINSKPIPSLLRGFSAPVRLKANYTEDELLFLYAHDMDAVARWEAGQQLLVREMHRLLQSPTSEVNPKLFAAMRANLLDKHLEPAFVALLLQIPDPSSLLIAMDKIDVEGICTVYHKILMGMLHHLRDDLISTYEANQMTTAYHVDVASVGRRSLKNVCLYYLGRINNEKIVQMITDQYYQADNMTDRVAALSAINNIDTPLRATLLNHFMTQWQAEPLVVDRWFALQAISELPNTTQIVADLLHHPNFAPQNPNKLYALLVSYSQRNFCSFHQHDGAGYRLLADEILRIDSFNPSVAARLVSSYSRWRSYDDSRQSLMREQLERILSHKGLSSDVHELVNKSLE
jgi:aminopeptidase N